MKEQWLMQDFIERDGLEDGVDVIEMNTTELIAKSPFCVFCIDEEIIQLARFHALWEYARQLKKPFLVFLKEGMVIPEDMLKGIDLINTEEWRPEDDDECEKHMREWRYRDERAV